MVEYLLNKASELEIAKHLLHCDADFIPPLSNRIDINKYAQKIASRATRFEAWSDSTLVGLVAAYCNDQENHIAYITSVSVERVGRPRHRRRFTKAVHHTRNGFRHAANQSGSREQQPARYQVI